MLHAISNFISHFGIILLLASLASVYFKWVRGKLGDDDYFWVVCFSFGFTILEVVGVFG